MLFLRLQNVSNKGARKTTPIMALYDEWRYEGVNVNIRMYNFDDIKCTITLSFAYDDVIGKNLRIY